MDKIMLINKYFKSWENNDISFIKENFSDHIFYVECYGPIYENKEQTIEWFSEWNKRGKVQKWEIKSIHNDNDAYFVEWNFKCIFDGNKSSFDGISLIEFDKNEKIKVIKEFESKEEHIYPYRKK